MTDSTAPDRIRGRDLRSKPPMLLFWWAEIPEEYDEDGWRQACQEIARFLSEDSWPLTLADRMRRLEEEIAPGKDVCQYGPGTDEHEEEESVPQEPAAAPSPA